MPAADGIRQKKEGHGGLLYHVDTSDQDAHCGAAAASAGGRDRRKRVARRTSGGAGGAFQDRAVCGNGPLFCQTGQPVLGSAFPALRRAGDRKAGGAQIFGPFFAQRPFFSDGSV